MVEAHYRLLLDGIQYVGKIGDISLSGAFLAFPEPELASPCVSKRGDLEIFIGNESVSLQCEVVYAGMRNNQIFPIGAGVVFIGDDNRNAAAVWNTIIDALMSK
jgi:hypothetical protein